MNISSVGSNIYSQIASGNRLTSAAVSPADLAISEKMKSQTGGLSQGASNIKDGISALNISDGALSGITDNLQRVHELSLKASNGLMSGEEKKAIQSEIDGLLQGINDIANGTEFNEKKLLNSEDGIHIASNPDGSGSDISRVDSTVKALGLDGFSVMGNFDINKVTDALSKVSSMRGGLGAQVNGLEHAYNQNQISIENVTSSQSKIADTDIPKAISEQKKKELLNTFQIMMQKQKQDNEVNNSARLFSGI
ncbi:MAG: flagellin [Lachnospiraceae bacterium]|nr:flagellin [Lachnospiraceae bacterium]